MSINPFERRFTMSAEEREEEIRKLLERNSKKTREEAASEVDARLMGANTELKAKEEADQPRIKVEEEDPEIYNKIKIRTNPKENLSGPSAQ